MMDFWTRTLPKPHTKTSTHKNQNPKLPNPNMFPTKKTQTTSFMGASKKVGKGKKTTSGSMDKFLKGYIQPR